MASTAPSQTAKAPSGSGSPASYVWLLYIVRVGESSDHYQQSLVGAFTDKQKAIDHATKVCDGKLMHVHHNDTSWFAACQGGVSYHATRELLH